MKVNVMLGAVAIFGLLGWNVQPGLADPEYEFSHASSSDHGCCQEMEKMMGHMSHHAHATDHFRHLLKHHKRLG